MFFMINDGPRVIETDFFRSDWAAAGYFFMSCNAGTWRLLVPPCQETTLPEMMTGKRATLTRSIVAPGRNVDLVFEDGTTRPFSISLDYEQLDRVPRPGKCRLRVYTRHGNALKMRLRIEKLGIRPAPGVVGGGPR